uniref:ATP-dependent Clp protease proteolytic subunit n=1 Tax=Gymnochlora stellata TaxID=67809 RepID=B5A4F6_GYMST|nr:chloroplast ATP-dependent Clp protease proteolytic subunit 6 [Gymnochlora stellata]
MRSKMMNYVSKYNSLPKVYKSFRYMRNKSYITSQLFENDLIYICLPINSNVSRLIMSPVFWYKHSKVPLLSIFLNSPEYLNKEILFNEIYLINFILTLNIQFTTTNLGLCYGDLSLLLAAGNINDRYMLKNSKCILHNIHNKHTIYEMYHTFFKKYWKEYIINHHKIMLYYQQFTSLGYNNINNITARKLYFKAIECKQYGIIDKII